ncbi:unnamed protein product [Brassicogethes aeneus]|uniref:E3 ubiquitin-protein ligase Mdm2 n=1 Tax=Brassicogethes aeneus TaxID=1431903 RepID=A0A9P0B0A0_BRAAE|nr:unnamed protein product [Brassicogethes aeneus]
MKFVPTWYTVIASWRKRSLEDDSHSLTLRDIKRPRLNYYRLASESSRCSEDTEDTESVWSVQDRDTDVIHDTSDTDTKSDCSSNKDEYEVEIEYEVASLSEADNYLSCSSTGSEDMMMAVAAVASVVWDDSIDITDSEDSDNSSSIESSFTRSFSTCIQCKFENNNPLYRYCEKCFQDRKKYFPPRPKGFRRRKKSSKNRREPPVKLDTLRSCLSGLSQMSQDSGIGSSQECPQLDLDRIVVPHYHLSQGTSSSSLTSSTTTSAVNGCSTSSLESVTLKEETKLSEIGTEDAGTSNLTASSTSGIGSGSGTSSSISSSENSGGSSSSLESVTLDTKSDVVSENDYKVAENDSEKGYNSSRSNANDSDLCMFCHSAPKDGIFLHTNIAHVCCCYKCAKKTLNTTKRCPICNRPVNKVVKIFSC